MRMVRGRSPFSADRTHLHHMLMDAGLSPAGTTAVEVLADAVVVGVFFISWKIAIIKTLQFLAVILCAVLVISIIVVLTRMVESVR